MIKLITLNLRNHKDNWGERIKILITTIKLLDPDVIAFQEVSTKIDQLEQIIECFKNFNIIYNRVFTKKWSPFSQEGIAFITKLNILEEKHIKLPYGGRVAQYIKVVHNHNEYSLLNTHLHHLPQKNELKRVKQSKKILYWIEENDKKDTIILGDLNSVPSSQVIREFKLKNYISGFRLLREDDPSQTFPSPLVKNTGKWYLPRTIDYILINPKYQNVHSIELCFHNPISRNSNDFASDHFGLIGKISKNN